MRKIIMKQPLWMLVFSLAFCAGTSSVQAAKAHAAKTAAEFPPGLFTDGRTYQISDYKGKVVVLWFFDIKDPARDKTLPPIFKLMQTYKDKPVIFLGVAPHATINETMAFINYTGSGIPSFADTLGIMAKHCGINPNKIALDPQQFRIIGPTGAVMANTFTETTMAAALTKAHFNFKGQGYDKRLNDVIDLLERGDYVKGAKNLDNFRAPPGKNKPDALHDSADQLFAALHKMGDGWCRILTNCPFVQ